MLRKLSRLARVFLAANSAVMFVVAFGISVLDSVGEMFDLIPRGGSVAMENTSAALAWAAA